MFCSDITTMSTFYMVPFSTPRPGEANRWHSFSFFPVALKPNSNRGSLIFFYVSRSHTVPNTHSRYDSLKHVISPLQRPLPTQNTQETNIVPSVGFEPAFQALEGIGIGYYMMTLEYLCARRH